MFAQMPAQETQRASARLLAGSLAFAMSRLLETCPRQQERLRPPQRIHQAHQVAAVVAAVEMVVTGKSMDIMTLFSCVFEGNQTDATPRIRLSNHWQWVIMLVILVVAIAGIWIGACIWRRKYLRKKDRQTSLGQKHSGSTTNPSWGPAITGSESATPMANNAAGRDPERGVVTEKSRNTKQKKKWTVTQRT